MTCGWCGKSVASANKPHTKGECEMSELTHRANTHMGNCKSFRGEDCNCGRNESAAELKSMQAKAAKYDALEQAARFIINNRDKFQEHDPDKAKEATLTMLAGVLDGVK